MNIYGIPGVAPFSGSNNLLTTAGGLGTATLGNVYNATNFTISNFNSSASGVSVTAAAATPLTAAYWQGGYGGNAWAVSDGAAAGNWVTTPAGGATSLIPGPAANVTLSASGASNQGNMVLGANMSIATLTVADSATVALNADGNSLAIGGAAAITVVAAAGPVTLNPNIALGNATPTITVNSSNGLTLGGAISGATGGLTTAGSGALTLSGQNVYAGGTNVTAGVLAVSQDANLGTNGVTLSGGTLQLTGASTFSSAKPITAQRRRHRRARRGHPRRGPQRRRAGQDRRRPAHVGQRRQQHLQRRHHHQRRRTGGHLSLATGQRQPDDQRGHAQVGGGSANYGQAVGLSGGGTFNVTNTASFSGGFTGSGGFVKQGAGVMVITGTTNNYNNYSGPTIVSGGTLQLAGGPSLPVTSGLEVRLDASVASSISLSGSTITSWNDLSGNGYNATVSANPNGLTAATFSGGGAGSKVLFNGSQALTVPLPTASLSSGFTLFVVGQKTGANNTYEALVSRSYAGYNGGAPWDMYNSNVFFQTSNKTSSATNPQTLTSPFVLELTGNAATLQEYVNGAQTVNVASPGNYNDNGNELYLGTRGDGVTRFTGNMEEVLVYSGTMSSANSAAVDTYLTNLWLNGGAGSGGNNVLPVTTPLTIAAGSTLDLNGGTQQVASLAGAGTVTNSGTTASVLTLSPTSAAAANFGGSIADGAGGVSVVVAGSATQIFSGANSSYTGTTTVKSGTLVFASIADDPSGANNVASSLGRPSSVANGTVTLGSATTNGTLMFAGSASCSSNRVISLALDGALDASGGSGATWTLTGGTAVAAHGNVLTLQGGGQGVIQGQVVNADSIIKSGAGTWNLLGPVTTMSNGGNEQINAGTLVLGGTLTVSNPASSFVLNGGTLASGASATVNGPIVGGSAAIACLAPGAAGPGGIGNLTVGSLSLNAMSELQFNIASTFTLDQITDNGNLSFSGGTVMVPAGLPKNTKYELIAYKGAAPSTSGVSLAALDGGSLSDCQLSTSANPGYLDLIVGGTPGAGITIAAGKTRFLTGVTTTGVITAR